MMARRVRWRCLLEAAEKTVSRSFLSVVCRESVSHASRTVVFLRSRMRCCVERMCVCVCVLVSVWVMINNMPALLAFSCNNNNNNNSNNNNKPD